MVRTRFLLSVEMAFKNYHKARLQLQDMVTKRVLNQRVKVPWNTETGRITFHKGRVVRVYCPPCNAQVNLEVQDKRGQIIVYVLDTARQVSEFSEDLVVAPDHPDAVRRITPH